MIRRRDILARVSFLGALFGGRRSHASPQPTVDAGDSRLVQSVDGPLIVTASLARQREMFEGGLGLTLVADQELGADAVRRLFGITGRTARTVLLQTKGTAIGVRLVEFRPASRSAVRESVQTVATDALDAVSFIAPDLDRAISALASRGFRLTAPPWNYATPQDGGITEARIEGPDGVICSLLKVRDVVIPKYVSVTDQIVSEVFRIQAPVSDLEPVLGFYRETLHLQTLRRYEVANESLQKRLGLKDPVLQGEVDFAGGPRSPLIGITHYQAPLPASRSVRRRAVLPHPGLQAIRLSVMSTEAVARAASAAGLEIAAPPDETLLFPQGRVKSILLRAPHGVLHHFTETLKA